MNKPDIFMALYIRDYLADTMGLTTEQHGAYLLLIMAEYMRGPLPDDDSTLAAITRLSPSAWESAKQVLKPYFQCSGGTWTNQRVETERAIAANFKKRASAGGKALKAKREAERSAKQALNECQTSAKSVLSECPSPSPSPSLIKANTLVNSGESTCERESLKDSQCQLVVDTWNQITDGKLPHARLTLKRQKVIAARLKEPGWFEDFERACEFVAHDDFSQGLSGKSQWKATIDYLLQPGKSTELSEKQMG